jgi:hypothetical protein
MAWYRRSAAMRTLDGEVFKTAEIASASVKFRRENCHKRETGPLPPAEASEQLFFCVLHGGLYAIDGGDGQWTYLALTQGIALRLWSQRRQ